MKPSFCGVGPFACQAFPHSMAAVSAHIGAPPGSMQVQPLVPVRMTVISPLGPIFKMVAPFNTAAGAASFSLSMSSWSVTTVCCAAAPEMAATRDELTASIMILRFMAPFVGLLPPVLARVPIGFLRLLSQKRKLPRAGAFRASPSIFTPPRRRFRPRPPTPISPYCNSTLLRPCGDDDSLARAQLHPVVSMGGE